MTAADDHAHDLPDGDLDGVGVLEHGQNKLGCDVMGGVAEVNSGHAPATMEIAIFAVAQRRGNRMWGGRPRPPTLFADVLTTRDTTLVKRHDECSTSICHSESASTLSFRIRFSGEESAFVSKSWIKKGYR